MLFQRYFSVLVFIFFITLTLYLLSALVGHVFLEKYRREGVKAVEKMRELDSQILLLQKKMEKAVDPSEIKKWAESKHYKVFVEDFLTKKESTKEDEEINKNNAWNLIRRYQSVFQDLNTTNSSDFVVDIRPES